MASSASFSTCRVEPGPDRLGSVLFGAGALAAALALLLSDLSPAVALGLWLLAMSAAAFEWRRRRRDRPAALLLFPDATVRLEWPRRPALDGQLRGWHRLGPLLVLDLGFAPGEGRRRRLDLWLPGLQDERGLIRMLARMHPVADATV
jgi:hypothetical protein